MKKVYLSILLVLLVYSPSILGCKGMTPEEKLEAEIQKILEHIKKNNPKAKPKQLPELILKYSLKYGIEPRLLSALFMAESSYRLDAINKKSNDYGIGQINAIHKLDKKRLITDLEYSVKHSARILHWFKQGYQETEPREWYCRYNVGIGKLLKNRKTICLAYLSKLGKYY